MLFIAYSLFPINFRLELLLEEEINCLWLHSLKNKYSTKY